MLYFKLTCGHQCGYLCHKGSCANANECIVKINIKCACKTLKKSVLCNQIKLDNDLIVSMKSKNGETKYLIRCNEKCDLKRVVKTDFKQQVTIDNKKTYDLNILKYLLISALILVFSVVLALKYF